MTDQNIRLLKHELGQFSGDDSLVELSDGSGYFATLTVFHGLHCVERLHHWLYKDLYYNNLTTEEERRLKQHTGEYTQNLPMSIAEHARTLCGLATSICTM